MKPKHAALQQTIGYQFDEPDLLVRALDDPLEVSAEVLVDGAVFNVAGVKSSNSSFGRVDLLKLIQGPLRVELAAVFDGPSQHVHTGVIYCHF